MYYTKSIRAVTILHISTSLPCRREGCLACELGFLFRMLEDAKGVNCHASNFLRVFKTIPQGEKKITKNTHTQSNI